jgi:hypothetical protein
MLMAWFEALGLGAGGNRWRWRELLGGGSLGPSFTIALAVAAPAVIAIALAPPTTPASLTGASGAIPIAPAVVGSLLDDRFELLLSGDQFEEFSAVNLLTSLHDRFHRDAIDLLYDLDLELVSDLGVIGQQSR